ncbi:MAG TPA: Gmad2 immunoglobulin-like domain-containing protein [Candidatus Paceibacterota bacterium]|nr:Gmad2 immunoglobulin-like domain-containing protein [Candidatus Paceibacterota bacterium]
MNKEFFGTKLNTVLLIILIILVFVAIKIMVLNKDTYLPFLKDYSKPSEQIVDSRILGNKDDLVSFSIVPGSKVHGVVSYRGVVKGGYFFEANIVVNILDSNKKLLKASNARAIDDWTTAGPVAFEGNIDFSSLPKGPAYLEIHNDNPSDIRANDKSILIPIVIE